MLYLSKRPTLQIPNSTLKASLRALGKWVGWVSVVADGLKPHAFLQSWGSVLDELHGV